MAAKVLSGGDLLMKKLEEIAAGMGGGAVSVGFLEGATYPDGTPVAAVAFWNEFGKAANVLTGRKAQPPRPFFRQMIAAESPTWPVKMAKLAKAFNYDGERVLSLMGEDIRDALKQSINNFKDPGLAQRTINAKGFSKPLVDTAQMLNSTGYEVQMNGNITFASGDTNVRT